MTTDTDTAAALEAAIDAIACRRCDSDDPIGSTDRSALHRAITAHVEAEVARRLAPNLELWRWKCHDETIEQAIERLVRERNEYAEKLCERNVALVMAPDVEAAIAQIVACTDLMDNAGSARAREALRAAIAADRARAVEAEATRRDAEIFGLRARLAIVAEIAEEAISSAPTPDEARRLVEEAIGAGMALACHGDWSDEQRAVDRAHADSARTALLRALGVES